MKENIHVRTREESKGTGTMASKTQEWRHLKDKTWPLISEPMKLVILHKHKTRKTTKETSWKETVVRRSQIRNLQFFNVYVDFFSIRTGVFKSCLVSIKPT